MARVTAATPKHGYLGGILLQVTGAALGAVNGSLFKALSPYLNELQTAWARYAVYAAIMVPIALWHREWRAFAPRQLSDQVMRALLQCFATWTFVIAAAGMPIADAISLIYVYPFVVALLAPWSLGERVRPIAWLGVIGGFVGVLIIMRPEFGAVNRNALWAVVSGVAIAVHLLYNRKVAATSSVLATSTFGGLIGLIVLSVLVSFDWKPIPPEAWPLVLALGVVSATNQWMIVTAFARVPASVLAPFGYVEIVAAALLGFLWFGDRPDALTWTGIAVIVACGLLVLRR